MKINHFVKNKKCLIFLFVCTTASFLLFFVSPEGPTSLSDNHNEKRTLNILTKCKYGVKGPRILCAIFTHKALHNTTLIPVHKTWAKR